MRPAFYLVTTELVPELVYAPRACHIVRRLRNNVRDDLALVDLEPPLPKGIYGTSEYVTRVMLASKHQGESLFPVREYPTYVYICHLNEPSLENSDNVGNSFQIWDWGAVYQDYETAAASIRHEHRGDLL